MDVIENSIWPGATSATLPAFAIAPQQPSSTQGAPQVASAGAVTATTPSAATPNVGYNLAHTVAPTDTSTAVPMERTIALTAYESDPADGKGGASGVGNAGGQVSVSGATVANTEISGGDGDGEARMKEEVMTEGGEEANDGRSRPAKRPRDTPLQVGLPKSMVRRIMKLGEDTRNISNEALVIVVKASELFLERFAAQAFSHAEKLGRRTIKYQDVSDVRVEDPNLLFLEAVVPP